MKKLLLTVALVTIFSFTYAQTDEGGWLVGASSDLSFTSTSIDGQDGNDSDFSLEAQAGYFIIDNLNVGLLIGFNSSKDGGSDFKSSSTVIGPYARYYVGGQFFVGVGYGITSAKFEDGDGNTLADPSGGTILLEAGYPIWIVDNVAVEPSLAYGIGTGDFDASSSFGLNIGFNLYF